VCRTVSYAFLRDVYARKHPHLFPGNLRELRPTLQQLSSALDAAAVSASCREHLSLQRSAARAVYFTAVAPAPAAAA